MCPKNPNIPENWFSPHGEKSSQIPVKRAAGSRALLIRRGGYGRTAGRRPSRCGVTRPPTPRSIVTQTPHGSKHQRAAADGYVTSVKRDPASSSSSVSGVCEKPCLSRFPQGCRPNRKWRMDVPALRCRKW